MLKLTLPVLTRDWHSWHATNLSISTCNTKHIGVDELHHLLLGDQISYGFSRVIFACLLHEKNRIHFHLFLGSSIWVDNGSNSNSMLEDCQYSCISWHVVGLHLHKLSLLATWHEDSHGSALGLWLGSNNSTRGAQSRLGSPTCYNTLSMTFGALGDNTSSPWSEHITWYILSWRTVVGC